MLFAVYSVAVVCLLRVWRGDTKRRRKRLEEIVRKRAFERGHQQALQLMVDGRAIESGPWPLVDVLSKLIEATDHLLVDHSCDRHGYEEFVQARDVAKIILADMKEPHDESQTSV